MGLSGVQKNTFKKIQNFFKNSIKKIFHLCDWKPTLKSNKSDYHVFAQSEVDQPAMSSQIENDVFRLEISVDDVDAVQVLDGQQDLRQVEDGHALLHSVRLFEEVEEVSARIIFGDEEHLLLSLKWADEFDLEMN